ncbi:hypothetical protein FGO68_gene9264 [Halteria grandinella]|uniref:Uncharacterized protein n=1 Tax=Halteria grandinella TaxID=5974 RepID=A0A8J8T4E6_HALGN|nr:hypothetical protein FGO68_gene9264 [Halteria grandinella]
MKKQKVGVVNVLSCNRLQQYPALWQFPIDFHTFTFSQLLNRQLDSACAFFSNESIYSGIPLLFSSFFVKFMWPFISSQKSVLVRFLSTNSKQLTKSSLGLQIPYTGYLSQSQQDQIYSPAELKTSLQANCSRFSTNMISFQV